MQVNEMASSPSKRTPLAAVLLSVAATGVGHLYCGRLVKGLILFFLSFAFAPLIVLAASTAASTGMLVLVVGSLLLMLGVFVYAAVDAGLLARRIGPEYRLKEYNRWYVYLILIVVSLTYPTNLASSIRDHMLQAFKIPSASMLPSILPHDFILVNKAVYKTRPPRRGDVVLFIYPNDRRLFFIKRLIALPGDSIEIREGTVYINDHPLSLKPAPPTGLPYYSPEKGERILLETSGENPYPILVGQAYGDMAKTVVPNGHCFVMGDNRGESMDSRQFGPVPLADVRGRLDYIYWPAKSWRRWGRYAY